MKDPFFVYLEAVPLIKMDAIFFTLHVETKMIN